MFWCCILFTLSFCSIIVLNKLNIHIDSNKPAKARSLVWPLLLQQLCPEDCHPSGTWAQAATQPALNKQRQRKYAGQALCRAAWPGCVKHVRKQGSAYPGLQEKSTKETWACLRLLKMLCRGDVWTELFYTLRTFSAYGLGEYVCAQLVGANTCPPVSVSQISLW